MLEKFGLNEQAQLKKNLEKLATEQLHKPFALAEAITRKAKKSAAPVEEIEGFSDGFSAFEKDSQFAPELRQEILTKTSQKIRG